jgi:hypothetical protein
MASKPAHETRIDADAPLEFVMPDEIEYPDLALVQIDGIPLYLIPRAIRELIQKKREAIASIDVRQGAGHFFTITVKTSERRIYRRSIALKQAAETGGESDE